MKAIKLMLLAVLMPLVMISCDDDDGDSPTGNSNPTGAEKATFELMIDGTKVKSGANAEVGMMSKDGGGFTSPVSVSVGNEFGIVCSGFSMTVGETSQIDATQVTVAITGSNLTDNSGNAEVLAAKSGSITRTSETKIEFTGELTNYTTMTTHQFSGFVQSDAFKLLQ